AEGRSPRGPDAPWGPFGAVRTRRVEFVAWDLDPRQLALSSDPGHLADLRQLGLISSICVALHFRGRTVGAMTFGRASETFRPLHVAFARTLGRRIGQAVTLGRMYEELQEANRRKDEFLAMLGHELRNPPAPLSNAVTALQAGRLPRETEASIHSIISRQLQHLTKLVGDLLDVARLTSGKIVLQPGPVDLLTVVERCLATIRGAGRGDDHEIRVDGHHVM